MQTKEFKSSARLGRLSKVGPIESAVVLYQGASVSQSSKISESNPIFDGSELVFGLVAPVGTNFDRFVNPLGKLLRDFEYEMNVVRISELFDKFSSEDDVQPNPTEGTDEYQRLMSGMHRGNKLRLASNRGEFLALGAAMAISERGLHGSEDKTRSRKVHVIRSLKHPDEVRACRRIYGNGFYLIGLTVDKAQRQDYLQTELNCDVNETNALIERDEHEDDTQYFGKDGYNYGQRTRDTFHLADVFLPLEEVEERERFLQLVFGDPFVTPTRDEHAMFMAFASALRSADLSRQVGSVIVSRDGDLVATGANDVARAGGGLYWPTDDDMRDHKYQGGVDSNEQQRNEILEDLLKRLVPEGVEPGTWIAEGKAKLKSSRVMDITEYGRAVHAEMEALMCCARSGTCPVGGTLYSTTYPCHNCAKHIVAAGIKRVVYVEPYPKSQAEKLFPESIQHHNSTDADNGARVVFEPFRGVGPKRFFDLFSMTLGWGTKIKRKLRGEKLPWDKSTANVRVPLLPNSYIDREVLAVEELVKLTDPKMSKIYRNETTAEGKIFWDSTVKAVTQVQNWPASKRAGINVSQLRARTESS